MALAILHREPATTPLPPAAPVWRTCLREVQFINENDERDDSLRQPGGDGQHLRDGHAYRLLLEILCGLQSPMLGETQVLGQFKSFLASLDDESAWLTRVGQRLLTDARDVRTRHLQGLGSRSYGSAIRRDLAGVDLAVLIGTGKLAAEVLPFMADEGRAVEQWGRADASDAPAGTSVRYRTLDALTDASRSALSARTAALVVAAPVPPDVIERVAACYPGLQRVIDLRADVGERRPALAAEILSLQDLFARMHAAHASALPQIEAARQDIAGRSRRYDLRDELRPFGWDDLCA